MDDFNTFKDLITPKVEIKEIRMDENEDKNEAADSPHKNFTDGDKGEAGDVPKQCNDVEKDFQFDEDETRIGIEQLGTLLSAFLQDDSGRNVVDAIVQNSKWQRNICRALEKISQQLEPKKNSHATNTSHE